MIGYNYFLDQAAFLQLLLYLLIPFEFFCEILEKNPKLSWLKDEWSFKEFQSQILNTPVPLLNFKQNSQVRIEAYQFYASKPFFFSLSFLFVED